MAINSLEKLFIDELKDLYSAENQIIKALPKMMKAATSPDLKAAFAEHLEQTRGQVTRLTEILGALGQKPGGKKCKAMEGLIEEGKEMIEEGGDPHALDAALISAAQKVEHYEMAGYGCARTYARLLGHREHAETLQTTLNEEGNTDKLLTKIALRTNVKAIGQGGSNGSAGAGKGGSKGGAKGGSKGGSKSSAKGGSKGGSKASGGR